MNLKYDRSKKSLSPTEKSTGLMKKIELNKYTDYKISRRERKRRQNSQRLWWKQEKTNREKISNFSHPNKRCKTIPRNELVTRSQMSDAKYYQWNGQIREEKNLIMTW